MKPKTMMLMIVAIGCGLAASYMTSRLLAERNTPQVEENKVKVLVAKIKVPAWAPIRDPEKYFEEKEIPESLAPRKGIKEFAKIKDQRLSQPLSEGEYALEDKLVNPDQVGLIAKLPPGMRAIALKVNAESLAGGFVLPGYRVDVVSTTRGGGNSESSAKIILQNMLVLAVDTVANRDNQTTSLLGSTVTLAATPEEAQRLSLAAAMGELRLTLRTPDDNKIVRLPGSRVEDLGRPTHEFAPGEEDMNPVASAPPVPPLPPLPKDPPPPTPTPTPAKVEVKAPEPPPLETHTLTIITGDYVQKARFVFDPMDKVWTNGSLDRGGEDAPPRRPASPAPKSTDGPPANSQPQGRVG